MEGNQSTGKLEVGGAFLENKGTGTAAAMATKDRKVHDINDDRAALPSGVLVGGWLNLPLALAGHAYAEAKPYIRQLPAGMVWWTCSIIVLLLLVVGQRSFEHFIGAAKDEGTGDQEEGLIVPAGADTLDLDDFQKHADNGDLDLYTCAALSCGRHQLGLQMFKFIPQLFAATVMQLLVGVLLLLARFPDGINEKTLELYPMRSDVAFRLAGLLLYAYAAYGLLHAMSDVCRERLLSYCYPRNISWYYEVPLLLGEFMNVFVGIVLQVILFVIFCKSRNAEDLTMNCLAVQFLCEIDNELVSDSIQEEAIENLKYAMIQWADADMKTHHDLPTGTILRHNLQHGVLMLSRFLKVIFMVMAVSLTFTFGFAKNPYLCDILRSYEPYPWCLGI